LLCVLLVLLGAGGTAWAELAAVDLSVPHADAWVGQRVAFFVELRARGPFQGTARFDLPELPGVLLLKLGSPVVGSRELDGENWFVQTHEFALFSQRSGTLELPPFTVRFASRDGFTGPAREQEASTQRARILIRRPPGSAETGFLVSTEELEVSETWDPQPGRAQVGAVLRRSIVQRARDVPAMALAPAPTGAIEGIRVYADEPLAGDRLERGEFLGERRDTLTYLLQEPGRFTLPAITYTWWNPRTESLASTTLPAVSFEVASGPAALAPGQATSGSRRACWLAGAALVAVLLAWRARGRARTVSPQHAALRTLRRACARNDAAAAYAAWTSWRSARDSPFEPDAELRAAVHELEAKLFGPAPEMAWRGEPLAHALGRQLRAERPPRSARRIAALPPLN
jgi:hypothetical protein